MSRRSWPATGAARRQQAAPLPRRRWSRAASSTPTPGIVAHDDADRPATRAAVALDAGARYTGVRPTLADFVLKMPRGAQVDLSQGPRADPDAGRHLPGRPGARVGRRLGRAVDDAAAGRRRRRRLRAPRGLRRPGAARTWPPSSATRRSTRYRSRCATATRASTSGDLDRVVLDLPEPWRVVHARGAAPAHRAGSSWPTRRRSPRPCSCARRSTRSALRHGRDHRGAAPGLAHRGPGGAARPPHGRPHRLPHQRPAARLTSGRRPPPMRRRELLDVVAAGRRRRRRRRRLPARLRRPRASWIGMLARHRRRRRWLLPRVLATAASDASERRRLLVVAVGLLVGGAFVGQAVGLVARRPAPRRRSPRRRPRAGRPVGRRRSPASSACSSSCGCCCRPWPTCPAGRPAQARAVADRRRARADALPAAARHPPGAAPARRRRPLPAGVRRPRAGARRSGRRRRERPRPADGRRGRALDGEGRGRACGRIQDGQRLRRRRPAWWSPTPTWWPGEDVDRRAAPDGATVDADGGGLRPRPRPGRAARAAASTAPALPLARRRGRATSAACSATPAAGRSSVARSRSADEVTAVGPRHLRRGRHRARGAGAAADLAPGDSGSAWSTPAARWSAWPSPSPPTAPASPTPSPPTSCEAVLDDGRSARTVAAGPCVRLTGSAADDATGAPGTSRHGSAARRRATSTTRPR